MDPNNAQFWRLRSYEYRDEARQWKGIALFLAVVLIAVTSVSIYQLVIA